MAVIMSVVVYLWLVVSYLWYRQGKQVGYKQGYKSGANDMLIQLRKTLLNVNATTNETFILPNDINKEYAVKVTLIK